MLREWIESRAVPAAPAARRLGLVYEAVAYHARARRQRRAWAPHHAAAQQAVAAVMARARGSDLAVVLGAGLLRDLPLEALMDRFARVLLVDVAPLAPLRRAVATAGRRRRRSLDLVTADVTGFLAPLDAWDCAGGVGPLPPVPDPAPLVAEAEAADLVMSSTLLSQIALPARAVLDRRGGTVADQEAVTRALIGAHLAALSRCRGAVCLITDFEREERHRPRRPGSPDPADRSPPTLRYDLLAGWRPVVEGARWWWSLAPPGEVHRRLAIRHRVVGGWFRDPGPPPAAGSPPPLPSPPPLSPSPALPEAGGAPLGADQELNPASANSL